MAGEELNIDLDALADPKEDKKDPVVEPARAAEGTRVPDDPTPDEGLEKLRRQLENERSLRVAAERRAAEASAGEARARGDQQTTQIDLLTNAITSVKATNDALKKEYSAAMAAQEFDRVADIQLEMSTNAAKLLALENGKSQLEKQPKPQPRPSADEVEEYASRIPAEYPRSRAWVREHPEYVRDPQKNRVMIAAHELALALGLKADSNEYFESIEGTLNMRKAPTANGAGNGNGNDPNHEDPNPMSDAAKPANTGRKPAPAAAPVSRSGNGTGQRPNSVTLSPEEQEIATMNGLTFEQYAANKVALKKEGRLN